MCLGPQKVWTTHTCLPLKVWTAYTCLPQKVWTAHTCLPLKPSCSLKAFLSWRSLELYLRACYGLSSFALQTWAAEEQQSLQAVEGFVIWHPASGLLFHPLSASSSPCKHFHLSRPKRCISHIIVIIADAAITAALFNNALFYVQWIFNDCILMILNFWKLYCNHWCTLLCSCPLTACGKICAFFWECLPRVRRMTLVASPSQ